MAALDNYGWRQRNPWNWGQDYVGNELVGSGQGNGSPTPTDPEVIGPYTTTDGILYWIDRTNCRVGYNIDPDADPDIWLNEQQFDEADIAQPGKNEIVVNMISNGCWLDSGGT